MDLGPAREPVIENLNTLPEVTWITPVPDGLVVPEGDPADVAVARDTIRLAFVAALQHLPPRQRAVLILCEVLKWKAAEVAELLETSVASVNSALQRSRATLETLDPSSSDAPESVDAALLERYVAAFENYDIEKLVELFTADAVWEMPPFDGWYQGPENIVLLSKTHCPAQGPGDMRFIITTANGQPAAALYMINRETGVHEPFQMHVLAVTPDGISHVVAFHMTSFEKFGLPDSL